MLLLVVCCFYRSSHRRCSVRKGVLRDFTKFTGKQVCQSLFFNQVAGLRPAALLKKRFWHRYFPVYFSKFLRTLFLQNNSGRLLLFLFFSKKWRISLFSVNNQTPKASNILVRDLTHSRIRSSHRRRSVKKGVLRNFAKFTGKHLCQRVHF